MAKTDPLYITWKKRNKNGRLEEVDIFEFIAHEMNRTTFEWNTQGLGSIVFKKGFLKILPFKEAGSGKGSNYETMWFELDLKVLQEATNRTTDFAAGLSILFKLLSDRTELVKLERQAYGFMIDLLTTYLGKRNALIIPSGYRSKPYNPPKAKKKGNKIARQKEWFQKSTHGVYSSQWNHLVYQIILNKTPKIVGNEVRSFSLKDLLSVQLPSVKSPLKSIFMMEEFGTGLYADPELRRPYLGAATPFKVPTEVAAQWGMPDAVFMWWPFFNFVQKAWFMRLNKIKSTRTTTTWIKKLKDTHGVQVSLNDYRKKAFASIKKYKEEGSLRNPLAWAYGDKRGGIGHPGREAQHLFFQKGGIVKEIRLIQAAGYRRLLQLIDAEIKKTVPGFASVADVVFPHDIGLNL